MSHSDSSANEEVITSSVNSTDQGQVRSVAQLKAEADATIRQANAAISRAHELVHKLRMLQVISLVLTVVGIAISLCYYGNAISEWLYGKTHQYRFSGIHAPEFSREQFEAEFSQRLMAKGYHVKRFHVEHESSNRQYDGDVILINVPSDVRDRDIHDLLDEVGKSLNSRPLQVEKP